MYINLMGEIIFLGNLQSGHLFDITEVLRLQGLNDFFYQQWSNFCQASMLVSFETRFATEVD